MYRLLVWCFCSRLLKSAVINKWWKPVIIKNKNPIKKRVFHFSRKQWILFWQPTTLWYVQHTNLHIHWLCETASLINSVGWCITRMQSSHPLGPTYFCLYVCISLKYFINISYINGYRNVHDNISICHPYPVKMVVVFHSLRYMQLHVFLYSNCVLNCHMAESGCGQTDNVDVTIDYSSHPLLICMWSSSTCK